MSKNIVEKTGLLQNSDGSIYHLNLHPGELAETIILVGDPDRVPHVSRHFDSIRIKKQKREFMTHTGILKGNSISVLSTGIGTDNIDIVMNECDALHNIDFDHLTIKKNIKSLRFLRLGTCGSLIKDIPVDALILSEVAIGFDGMMSFYQYEPSSREESLLKAVQSHFQAFPAFRNAYVAYGHEGFSKALSSSCHRGVTLTCSGFYGPQYRSLRAPLISENLLHAARSFNFLPITNVEMETVAIYALSHCLGHQACSISVVIDNVEKQTASANIPKAIDNMIESTIVQLF